MGFYIHNCEKMKYKAEYQPSDLLCPTTLKWIPFSDAAPILNKYKFSPLEKTLAEERDSIGEDTDQLYKYVPIIEGSISIEEIQLSIASSDIVNINHMTRKGQQFLKPILEEFSSFVGPIMSRRLVVCFN